MSINISGCNSPTAGSVAVGDGTSLAFTAVGTCGQVLKSTGSGTPVWGSSPAPSCATPTVAGIVYGKTSNCLFNGGVSLGYNAGATCQGSRATAIGVGAGSANQGCNSVAIGSSAGSSNQGYGAIAIGQLASCLNQGCDSIAIGRRTSTPACSIAIGSYARIFDINPSIVIGNYSVSGGSNNIILGKSSIACGTSDTIIIGNNITVTSSGLYIDPIRNTTCAGGSPVGLGYCTTSKEIVYGVSGGGGGSCATPTVAGIVYGTTRNNGGFPGDGAVSLGYYAGVTSLGSNAVAIGSSAGQSIPAGSVVIGAGASIYGTFSSVVIGFTASSCGPNNIAIGTSATICSRNSIVIGNSSLALSSGSGSIIIGSCITTSSDGLYISPIRNVTGARYLGYNTCTKEVTYSTGAPSDINLKDNIQVIGCALNKTAQIRGVTFNWKKCGAPSVGVIAQELEQVFPEMVTLEGDGYKTVKYDNMVAVLVEAVKELKARIEVLEQLNKGSY